MLKKAKIRLLTGAAHYGECVFARVYRAATVREPVPAKDSNDGDTSNGSLAAQHGAIDRCALISPAPVGAAAEAREDLLGKLASHLGLLSQALTRTYFSQATQSRRL
jgi:hypothetical protein